MESYLLSLRDLLGSGIKKLKRNEVAWVYTACLILALIAILLFVDAAHAQSVKLPGSDESDKLEAAGTLLRIIDTSLFNWGARILAGVFLIYGATALPKSQFGMAIICIIAAIVLGTLPMWIKNIFSISGSNSIFSQIKIERTVIAKETTYDSAESQNV